MKISIRKLVIVLAAGTLAAACAATDTQRSTGQYVDDTALTARVKTALAEDPVAKAHQIDVEVNRGVVQLNGFVDSSEQRSKATVVARGIDGVREVRNQIDLKPPAS
jgi:hyperosmotically inducible periplasmic protein